MDLNEYQSKTSNTAIYPNRGKNYLYPLLGLLGEIGELIEKLGVTIDQTNIDESNTSFYKWGVFKNIDDLQLPLLKCNETKKLIRDKRIGTKTLFHSSDEKIKEEIKQELGDVLWYVSELATEFGLSLDEIAEYNISKLQDRKERNILTGSGDKR